MRCHCIFSFFLAFLFSKLFFYISNVSFTFGAELLTHTISVVRIKLSNNTAMLPSYSLRSKI
jgi:hypothetical protein